MELLVLIPLFAFLAIYVAYKEWLNIAYKQWRKELELFNKRLAAYEQLKSAVAPVRVKGAVSETDTNCFARAMSDMQFLFDKDVETFVDGIYSALLKKHALDSLIEQAAVRKQSPADKALTEEAARKSQELSSQITNGIFKDMPKRMEKFMRPRPVL